VLGALQALVFVAVLMPFGARVHAGVPGLLVLIVVGLLLGVGIGGLGVALALRTGSSEAVQGAFPVIFVLLFTSSAFFPRQLMNGWYQSVADANPVSHLIEGARHLVTDGWDASEAATAIALALALCAFSIGLSLLALRRRLRVAA
jgi:ABC-2 type transport system permease protein